MMPTIPICDPFSSFSEITTRFYPESAPSEGAAEGSASCSWALQQDAKGYHLKDEYAIFSSRIAATLPPLLLF